jgi:thymidylate synthase
MKKVVKSIKEINKMADEHAQSWIGVHTSKYMTNGELLPKYKVHYESFLEGALSRQSEIDELQKCIKSLRKELRNVQIKK